MRLALVDQLEEFVRRGVLWDGAELAGVVDGWEVETAASGDAIPALLAQPLRLVLTRLLRAPLDQRTACDVEAVVYPRLWKVMEAVRDELPDGELRIRIEVFRARLAGCLDGRPAVAGPGPAALEAVASARPARP